MNNLPLPELSINGQESSPVTWQDAEQAIATYLLTHQYAEIWLRVGNTLALAMFVNGTSAWLMFLLNQDEECYHTSNPEFEGDAASTIDYYLSNGQHDIYPAAWAIGTDAAMLGMKHFFGTGRRSSGLSWVRD
jgi:hypothetical protein